MSGKGDIVRTTEWEGEHTRLVRLSGLPTGRGTYRKRPVQQISWVIVHQSAGNALMGLDAPYKIARFHTSEPKYKLGPDGKPMYRTVRGRKRKWWIGGGRGWPAIAYHFVIPAVPDVVDGKFEVYRCLDDDVHSYHTGPGHNRSGVGVVVAGRYKSRHAPKHGGLDRPDLSATLALRELVLDYLLPRYSLDKIEGLLGHFDAGKLTCPGDWLEQWVRFHRGEEVADPDDPITEPIDLDNVGSDERPLDTDRDRQQALAELGFDVVPDGVFGPYTKAAVEAFQMLAGLDPTGYLDDLTLDRLRRALAAKAHGMWEPV